MRPKGKVVIVGGGGHARVLTSIIKMGGGFEIAGYTDIRDGDLNGITYLGDDSILDELFNAGTTKAVLGLGSLGNSAKRQSLFNSLKNIGFEFPTIVASSAVIHPDVQLGAGTVVMDGVVVNPNCRVGDCVILNTNSTIEHDCDVDDFVHISPGVTIGGGVSIGKNCHVGIGSTVIQGIRISKDSFIAAGAVVVNDCTFPGKYRGVPARLYEKPEN